MKRFLPAALMLLTVAGALAQDAVTKEQSIVKTQTTQQAALQQKAVAQAKEAAAQAKEAAAGPLRAGQSGPLQFQRGVMKSSADWLKQTPQIVQFINENGCAIKDGKFATVKMSCAAGAADCVDFSKIVDEVAKNTEVLYVDAPTMTILTGEPKAIAFGVTKELKKLIRAPTKPGPPDPSDPGRPVILGRAPDKNTIALRGDPVGADQKAPDSGILSLVFAHEFLHITLRQIDNPALGGGARKEKPDPDIAITHHRLTDVLQWKRVSWNQGDGKWTPGPDPNAACAKAGQDVPRAAP